MKLKAKHYDTILNKYLMVLAQIKYHNDVVVPELNNLNKWEQKEYLLIHELNINKLKNYTDILRENESSFNEILYEYGSTVTMFLYKNSLN